MNRRQFTSEFKLEAVRLAESKQKTIAQTARDLGINESLLYKWVNAFGTGNNDYGKPTPNEHEELLRLRRENKILKEERDILKKAAAYFAKEQL